MKRSHCKHSKAVWAYDSNSGWDSFTCPTCGKELDKVMLLSTRLANIVLAPDPCREYRYTIDRTFTR